VEYNSLAFLLPDDTPRVTFVRFSKCQFNIKLVPACNANAVDLAEFSLAPASPMGWQRIFETDPACPRAQKTRN